MPDDNNLSRRRFLQATGGAASAAVIAGCTGQQDTPTETQAGTDTPTPTATPEETDSPTPTPVPKVLDLEAVDDKTLRVNLSQAFHASLEMLAYTSFAAVPEGIVGDLPAHFDYDGEMEYQEFATGNPIGAGPFSFDHWTQGTEAQVNKYDDYHGSPAKVNSVHWQVFEDDTAQYNYAMNENADVFTIPTAQYDPGKVTVDEEDAEGRLIGSYGELRNGKTANYVGVSTIDTFYVGFNMAKVPKPVRQAFAYVTNQELLVNEVFKQRGTAAYHFTPPAIYPGGANEYNSHAENSYPYGYNKSQINKAKQVMEEAGYGPNNRFEVQWTQYQSNTWLEMAQILRDQLSSAYIDMKIEQAPFSTLLQRGRNGNLEAYTLGWIADWPAPDNFLQLLNPPQTDTSKSAPTSYINWLPENADQSQAASDAWSQVANNLAPTDSAQSAREEAYVTIEEANWEDVGFINIFHSLSERFHYDWVDIAPQGGMGFSRMMLNDVTKSSHGTDQLNLMAGTMTTFDPIAATDTESGRVIQQMFDALTNYPQGKPAVENLLASDFEVSDDYLTYTFNIKEDATFHNGDDVTAQDFVYSWNRLAYSNNSRRAYFVLDSLGVNENEVS